MEGRRVVGLSRAERAFERGGHAIGGSLDVLWGIPAAIRANRALLAGAIAVLVAALALSLSAGGFGVVEASQAVPVAGRPGAGRGSGRAVVGGAGIVVAGRIAGLRVGAAGPASADRRRRSASSRRRPNRAVGPAFGVAVLTYSSGASAQRSISRS